MKKKNDNIILFAILIGILLFAFLIGTGLFNLFIKHAPIGKSGESSNPPVTKVSKDNSAQNPNFNFVAVQCGYFENKDYADAEKNKVKTITNPFVVTDENKYRVLCGVYDSDDLLKSTIDKLNSNNEKVIKIAFQINKNDACDVEIGGILDGLLTMTNSFLDSNVSTVSYDSLKKWVSDNIKDVDSKSKNYSTMQELKKTVSGMPDKMTKDKVEENYVLIYSTLKKITSK
jgi:Cell division protein